MVSTAPESVVHEARTSQPGKTAMAMFNKSRDAEPLPASFGTQGGKRGVFSVLGSDVTITGNIAATTDLHIEGTVHGDVACANLVQGAGSRITGNVQAETARLAGTIDGTVAVRQLTVERAARITGDVEYEDIAMEKGASIDGRLKHISGTSQPRAETVHLLGSGDAAG